MALATHGPMAPPKYVFFWYIMTAQIYNKIQNAYALSGNQQYKFVSHTRLEKR